MDTTPNFEVTETDARASTGTIIPNNASVQQVLLYPNEVFSQKSKDVSDDMEFNQYLNDLIPTMLIYRGIGLAAVQVGWMDKAVAVLTSPKNGQIIVALNPKITDYGDETAFEKEGCLSLPGIFVPVRRFKEVSVSYTDLDGNEVSMAAEGLEARVWQHEIDHTEGIFHLDHLSDWRKRETLAKYQKHLSKIHKKMKRG